MSQKTKKQFKASRLQFTEEERADPTLEKPIEKSEKAADKLEKAQAKIPQKTVKTKERTFDAETGKLGHSDINTTMNIYDHATRESKRNSVILLETATI